MTESDRPKSHRLLQVALIVLIVSAAYLYSFPQPNLPYVAIVLLHTVVGGVAAVLLTMRLPRMLCTVSNCGGAGWLLIAAGSVVGLVLIKVGTPRSEWKWLYGHIALALLGVSFLIGDRVSRGLISSKATVALVSVSVVAGFSYGAEHLRQSWHTPVSYTHLTLPTICSV